MPKSKSIRYADLVCLISGHDAEWSRRTKGVGSNKENSLDASFERVFQEIEGICGNFRNNLNTYAKIAHPTVCNEEAGLVPAHFFKPLRYLPIGHADALAITIFDDIDPIHSLTARCSTTVEEVAIGFAPLIESLGATDWPPRYRSCIIDVEEFVQQDLPPLLLFSRIKLGAMGLLGNGIDFQTEVFEAILRSCLSSLATLDELANSGVLAQFDADEASILSTRIAILDLQGQEEVGLLVACDNYSIAAALLSRIQAMSLTDVMQAGPDKESSLHNKPWIAQAKVLLADMDFPPGEDFYASLKSSHALRWTRTTLAVRQRAFKDVQSVPIRGYIDLVSAINIAVGHQSLVDDLLEIVQTNIAQSQDKKVSIPPKLFRQQLMGHADLLVHQSHPGNSSCRLIPTLKAIQQVRTLIERLAGDESDYHGMPRHLVGFSSWPTIPVPIHDQFRPWPGNHYALLQKILPALRWRMVDLDSEKAPLVNSAERDYILTNRRVKTGYRVNAGMCPFTLCAEPKKYLAPSSLIRTVQYLFQNYATLLSNPYVFDTVIDLYDCFSTLYDILTKHLVNLYANPNELSNGSLQQVPAEIVSQLSRYVSALHRAMEHRLYHAFPEEAHRDMDVDFRGGLNQLISGADALVKTAVGFVKRFALPDGAFSEPGAPRFNLFGVVNRIDFEPEIVATSLWLGVEDRARLVIIRSDVPHLCVVASYLDFIHEVGHVVFAEHRHPRSVERSPLLPLVPLKSATEELLSEIFTHILTTLLVCRDKPDVLAKHSMVSFALATRHGADIATRYASFLRFSFQVFIAAYCVEEICRISAEDKRGWLVFSDGPQAALAIEDLCADREVTRDKFREFLDKFGGICHDYATYREEDRNSTIFEVEFDYHWECIRYSLPILVEDAISVFIRYANAVSVDQTNDQEVATSLSYERMAEFESAVREALIDEANKGIPVVHVASEIAVRLGRSAQIDPMHMISIALGAALRFRMESLELDKSFHVPIDAKTGEIAFPLSADGSECEYSEYLIRSKDSFLFCCKPQKRRERLQRQIALLKSLWHTASLIKARRFECLIENSISFPVE